MAKIKSQKIDYISPGKPMSQREFEQMIRNAEKGPFYSIEEVKVEFEKWKAKYSR